MSGETIGTLCVFGVTCLVMSPLLIRVSKLWWQELTSAIREVPLKKATDSSHKASDGA